MEASSSEPQHETFLRAWRGLAAFESRSSIRTWLYTIATNACLDALARRPKRMLPIGYGPASEPGRDVDEPPVESVWLEPYPDESGRARGRVRGDRGPLRAARGRRACVHRGASALPPRQRAVLVLREVLGVSAREVSESLAATVASVNSALQRARKAIEARLPDRSQQATLRALGLSGAVDSCSSGDSRAPVCRDDARRSEAGSGRTDEFSVVCRSPLRVCPWQGEMRPEQAAERGVVR